MSYTRLDAARHAAGLIYGDVVARLKNPEPERYPDMSKHRACLDIENRIAHSMGRSYKDALALMLAEGQHELQMIYLTGYDPREDAIDSDDPDAGKSKLQLLKEACQATIREVEELQGHRCEFSEDDYCVTCGLDGRA